MDAAKRDLTDEQWLDASPCLVVTQRKAGLTHALEQLKKVKAKAAGTSSAEWDAVDDNRRDLKVLCMEILQHKFAEDKARRAATNLLINNIEGLKVHEKNIAGGVSTSWMSSSTVSKAKGAFGNSVKKGSLK